MYHVLIFYKGGKYSLDIVGEEEEEIPFFTSLDDLIVFCMSHKMKMEGDEVNEDSESLQCASCYYACICMCN